MTATPEQVALVEEMRDAEKDRALDSLSQAWHMERHEALDALLKEREELLKSQAEAVEAVHDALDWR
jgi:hypothetical protein